MSNTNLTEKLRFWSYQKQLLNQQGSSLPDVLKQVVAVYSNHPSGPISLWARSATFSPEAFRALDAEQLAARIPCMRYSVHMVPVFAAQTLFSASLPAASSGHFEARYSEEGRKIPTADFPAWKAALLKVLNAPKTVKELKALDLVPADKLKFVLNRMAFEGDVVRVGATGLRSNIISYAAATSVNGLQLSETDATKARTQLAEWYFRAFGPARINDFKWWVGITLAEASKAIEPLPLVEVAPDYFLLAEEADAFAAFEPAPHNHLDILPQWDCYTMAYPADGRARFIDEAHLSTLYGKLGATGGNALGAILLGGKAEAMWTSRAKGTTMEVTATVFNGIGKRDLKRIAQKFDEIAPLLGAKKVQLQFS